MVTRTAHGRHRGTTSARSAGSAVSGVWGRMGRVSEEYDHDGRAGRVPGRECGAGQADRAGSAGPAEPDDYVELVLDTVDLIPAGRVMTYGDVAEWLDAGGPRQVGRVLSRYGGGVPWWRVVRADGVLLPGHELRALAAYRAEGTPLRQRGPTAEGHLPRVDLRRARWDGRPAAAAPPPVDAPAADPPRVADGRTTAGRDKRPPGGGASGGGDGAG